MQIILGHFKVKGVKRRTFLKHPVSYPWCVYIISPDTVRSHLKQTGRKCCIPYQKKKIHYKPVSSLVFERNWCSRMIIGMLVSGNCSFLETLNYLIHVPGARRKFLRDQCIFFKVNMLLLNIMVAMKCGDFVLASIGIKGLNSSLLVETSTMNLHETFPVLCSSHNTFHHK